MSTNQTPRISRRTLAAGAAWSVPVVATAAAAPRVSASGTIWFEPVGLACKTPGASCEKETGITKGYVVRVRLCSSLTDGALLTVHDASVSLSGAAATHWEVKVDPQNAWFLAGGSQTSPDPGGDPDPILKIPALTAGQSQVCTIVDFGIEGTPSSSNVSISGTAPYDYVTTGGVAGSGTVTLSATATPPCDSCQVVDVPNP